MRRYHFSIAGEAYELGLAGALFAATDQEALVMLDEILTLCEGATIIDNYRGPDPDVRAVLAPKISYVSLATNGLRATMAMFDDIEGDIVDEHAGAGAGKSATMGVIEPRGRTHVVAEYAFVDRTPESDCEAHRWELLVNGEPTEWTFYELHPSAAYYARGRYGFIENNSEPQFTRLDHAQVALACAWKRANGTRAIDT